MDTPPAQSAITVSALNRQARALLDQGLARLWVEGEISNLARPASGHLYFSLKDDSAQLRCAWFRQRQRGPTIGLKNGDQVLAFGKVSIYEARGEYQLVVEQLQDAGEGELRRRFELLQKKLAQEGLFAMERKRPLPPLPRRIGVITSPSGAALHDILTVLERRFPAVPVIIYPSAVQGDAAPAELERALATAAARAECDVLIVGRGGGSLEDLWSFNEESVARAIADCPIPVVSAVGHEVDFTIADLVADVRAPTPTAAAELVVPDQAEWRRSYAAAAARIAQLGRRMLDDRAQMLDWLGKRLTQSSPAATVLRQSAWLANLRQVMSGAMRHDLSSRAHGLGQLRSRLLQQSPAIQVQRSMQTLSGLQDRLQNAARQSLGGLQHRAQLAAAALNAVSPLATLQRGYAIVRDAETGAVVRDAANLHSGDRVQAQLARGSISATVVASHEAEDE
ncbi:MAG: exodeoxyribonuclease VII large subunit [Gammaproteobacteria bacterium]|nr:MAG: exodeoxyribonuclease VII large subunit [Gammaproteobacteria bacterium]